MSTQVLAHQNLSATSATFLPAFATRSRIQTLQREIIAARRHALAHEATPSWFVLFRSQVCSVGEVLGFRHSSAHRCERGFGEGLPSRGVSFKIRLGVASERRLKDLSRAVVS